MGIRLGTRTREKLENEFNIDSVSCLLEASVCNRPSCFKRPCEMPGDGSDPLSQESLQTPARRWQVTRRFHRAGGLEEPAPLQAPTLPKPPAKCPDPRAGLASPEQRGDI